jgi:hypothetical protein
MKRKIASVSCLLTAAALCLGAAMHAEQSQTQNKKTWNQQNARLAFDMALTRSGYDKAFRDRLTASPDSAKQAVADEGQIAIPKEIVILFHPDKSNENYHIFDLPEFDGDASKAHLYQQYFQCCYKPW